MRQSAGGDRLATWSLAINQPWTIAAAIGWDLLTWFRLLCCETALAIAEPATLLHTSARLVRGQ
ncbi:hypothetical protein GCM10022419_118160 [Nonomuraea rosea]|uniref:Uncharacterized protein n=1 Tax=Nonomuraea rosea TaxID=638574 RepID=A0ABP6ZM98_9ACTN